MSFNWQFVEDSVETILGRGAFIADSEGRSGMIVKDRTLLAIITAGKVDNTAFLSFRASVLPNIAAQLAAQLSVKIKIELDPYFEFDNNGDMLFGKKALGFFVDNARLLVFGDAPPSTTSILVRPSGSYRKHKLN